MAGIEGNDDELRQADLSHLRVSEMTPEQKSELRRRYFDFVRRIGKSPPPAAPARSAKPVKWVPGKRTR